jgi:peptide/nickel transport system substrate-binding protein
MSDNQDYPSRHVLGLPLIGIAAVAAVAITAAAFFALTPLIGSDNEETLVYAEATAGAPSRVNPLYAYLNETDRDITSLVFSGLTRLGGDGEVLPDLAETWEINENAVTFHLREGVEWHTGVPFTSADVLFTFRLLADPEFQGDPDQGPLWRQISCNTPNELTVICRLPQPFAPFLAFTTIGIVPKHILEGVAAADLIDNPFNLAPIGTGPYRLTQIDSQRTVLQAFESYHLGSPALPEIQIQFYANSSTAAAAVLRGDADGLMIDSRAAQLDYSALSSKDGLRDYTANRSTYTVLYLNNREPPLNEVEIRKAIALAIDLDAITGDILGGRAVRAASPIVPGTWAFNPDVDPPGRDLGDARDLLDDAGWELSDGADVRARNDTELRISIMTDQDPVRGAVAEALADQLAEIGIAVTVVREQSTELIRDFLLPREYQAAIFSWDPGGDPDPYPAWHSSQITATGRNIAAYSNNDADKLMEDGRRTFDLDERQRLYFLFQQTFQADSPSIVLYYPVFTYFVSEKVRGIELGTLFTPASRFANVHEWTLNDSPTIGG